MKSNLKKITDKTIQSLLQNEIILPSSYFKLFDENAKHFSVEFQDAQFESEISDVLADELKNINDYMQKAVANIDILTEATVNAQKAIKTKDEDGLQAVNSTLVDMKAEINALRHQIYLDPLTKTFNRRWIYNHAINKDGTFKNNGTLLFIDLTDREYLADKYGYQLADNVTLYIAKFLIEKFKNEHIDSKIARYSDSQFVLFIKKENATEIAPFLKNIRLELANTTLKSKSGLMFKTSFHFGLIEYSATENFQDTLERAASLSVKEKESVKNSPQTND